MFWKYLEYAPLTLQTTNTFLHRVQNTCRYYVFTKKLKNVTNSKTYVLLIASSQ